MRRNRAWISVPQESAVSGRIAHSLGYFAPICLYCTLLPIISLPAEQCSLDILNNIKTEKGRFYDGE